MKPGRSLSNAQVTTALALALTLTTSALAAQTASTPVALSMSGAGPNGVLSTFDSETGSQSDVIFGRSGVNTYPLSWRNSRLHSDSVVADGQPLQRDLDYTFDNVAGAIKFSRSLAVGALVRVTYRVDTPDAARNAPALGSLASWELWQAGNNHLRLRMLTEDNSTAHLLSTPGATPATSFGRNALQWNGTTYLFQRPSSDKKIANKLDNILDSKLFLDLAGGDLLQRSGLGLTDRTILGRTQFGLSYVHGGTLFTQSTESGIAAGTDVYEARLSTVAAIDKNSVTVAGGLKQTTQLLVPPTATTASAPTTTTSATPTTPVTTTEANASVAIELAALNKTKVSASVTDKYQQDGLYRTGEAKVQLPKLPVGQTQISGGVQYNSDPHQERIVGLLTATTRPSRYLEVSGDVRLRDSLFSDINTGTLNTYAMKVNFAPLKTVKLTGDITVNPEQDGTARRAQRNAVGLTTNFGSVVLRGQFGINEDFTTARSTDSSELGIDLHFTKFDMLTTGWKGQNFFDRSTPGTYTYLIGFTHRLGSLLDMSLNGSYTQPTVGADPNHTELKTEARLGLKF